MDENAAPSALSKSSTSASQPYRILLVDDDEATIESVRFALERQGYAVFTAINGTEALALVDMAQPDLIVLDVMMPEQGGYEVLGELRRVVDRPLPVIMATAHEAEGHEAFAEVLGATALIRKPYRMEFLIEAIEHHLAATAASSAPV